MYDVRHVRLLVYLNLGIKKLIVFKTLGFFICIWRKNAQLLLNCITFAALTNFSNIKNVVRPLIISI
jgi:hypothetical protein